MTNNLLLKHPDLTDVLRVNPTLKHYKIVDAENNLVECWEKNEDEQWIDTTNIELAKLEIAAAIAEIDALENKACK